MTLNDILTQTYNSIGYNIYGISISSQNFSGSNIQGYHDLTGMFTTNSWGGINFSVKRREDEVLRNKMFQQTSLASQSSQTSSLYSQMEQALGLDDKTNFPLSDYMSKFSQAFTTLSAKPGDGLNKSSVISSAQQLADEMNRIGKKIKDLNNQGAQNISDDIKAINDTLAKLHKVNEQLKMHSQADDPVTNSSLKDQRDQLVNTLSQYIKVNMTENVDGTVSITTEQGYNLLDQSTYHPMKYDNVDAAFGTANVQGLSLGAGNLTLSTPSGGNVDFTITAGEDINTLVKKINSVPGYRATVDVNGHLKISSTGGPITINGDANTLTSLGYTAGQTYQDHQAEITIDGSNRILTDQLSAGKLESDSDFIRTDAAGMQSTDPNVAQVGKLEKQLNSLAQLLTDQGPNSFEAAFQGFTTPPVIPTAPPYTDYWANSLFVPANMEDTPPGSDISCMNLMVNPKFAKDPSLIDAKNAANVADFFKSPLPTLNPPYVAAGGYDPKEAFPGMDTSGATFLTIFNMVGATVASNASRVGDSANTQTGVLQRMSQTLQGETGVNTTEQQNFVGLLSTSNQALSELLKSVKTMQKELIGIINA